MRYHDKPVFNSLLSVSHPFYDILSFLAADIGGIGEDKLNGEVTAGLKRRHVDIAPRAIDVREHSRDEEVLLVRVTIAWVGTVLLHHGDKHVNEVRLVSHMKQDVVAAGDASHHGSVLQAGSIAMAPSDEVQNKAVPSSRVFLLWETESGVACDFA